MVENFNGTINNLIYFNHMFILFIHFLRNKMLKYNRNIIFCLFMPIQSDIQSSWPWVISTQFCSYLSPYFLANRISIFLITCENCESCTRRSAISCLSRGMSSCCWLAALLSAMTALAAATMSRPSWSPASAAQQPPPTLGRTLSCWSGRKVQNSRNLAQTCRPCVTMCGVESTMQYSEKELPRRI